MNNPSSNVGWAMPTLIGLAFNTSKIKDSAFITMVTTIRTFTKTLFVILNEVKNLNLVLKLLNTAIAFRSSAN